MNEPADVERILAEAPWLRRLARGLVGQEAAAEDLSQEVLAVALAERPDLQGLDGPRLRGWLRTVARRVAGRARERERVRRTAEATAARDGHAARTEGPARLEGEPRPEREAHTERAASERLELHRRLSAALERLPPLYRTALVLRFLEELPPREIAARLGIAPTAARKRVSRGLALLREELDRDFGGRDAWLTALAPLVAGGPPPLPGSTRPSAEPGPLATTASLLEVTVMGLSLPKLAATAAAVLGATLWLAQRAPEAGAPRALTVAVPETAAAPAPPALGARAADPLEAGARRTPVVSGEPDEPAEPETPGPLLRVVGPEGRAVEGAHAAWLDARADVRALELTADGTARLSGEAGEGWVVARAPGRAPALERVEGAPEVTLVLERARTVRARLTEDGAPPREPLELYLSYLEPAADELDPAAVDALEGLDLLLAGGPTPVAADGTFELVDLAPGQAVRVALPPQSTHLLLGVDGEPWGGDRRQCTMVPGAELLLDTVRLPEVRARVVWDDDGRPVARCGLMVVIQARTTANSMAVGTQTDDEGVLRFGVPVAERALWQDAAARAAAIEARWIEIVINPRGGTELRRRVDLVGARFPIDLGELRVRRLPQVEVQVTDLEGMPVDEALVRTGRSHSARTDASGAALVPALPGDSLEVMAAGFAPGEGSVPQSLEGTGPVAIRLEPGFALELVAERLPRGVFSPIRIAWDRAPFVEYEGPRQVSRLRYAFCGFVVSNWSEPGFMSFTVHDRDPSEALRVLVPALVPGSRLTASLRDCMDQPLVEREVTVPDEPGTLEVRLDLQPEEVAWIELELVDPDGAPVDGAASVSRGSTSRRFDVAASRGRSAALVPGRYDLSIEASGFLPAELPGVLAGPGSAPQVVTLRRASSLTVEAREQGGRPLTGRALLITSDGRRLDPVQASTGLWTFDPVPLEPAELELQVGARTWTRAVPAGETRVTLALPRHGELVAAWAAPIGAGSLATFGIEVAAADGSGPGEAKTSPSTGEAGTSPSLGAAERSFSPGEVALVETRLDLLPGDYEVTFVLRQQVAHGAEARQVLGQRRVTVAAEGTTRVSLE